MVLRVVTAYLVACLVAALLLAAQRRTYPGAGGMLWVVAALTLILAVSVPVLVVLALVSLVTPTGDGRATCSRAGCAGSPNHRGPHTTATGEQWYDGGSGG